MLNALGKAIAANAACAATVDIHAFSLSFRFLIDRDRCYLKKNEGGEFPLDVQKYYKYRLRRIGRHFNVTFQVCLKVPYGQRCGGSTRCGSEFMRRCGGSLM